MAWPWQFIDLTDSEVKARRIVLDRYGLYAQLSPIVPILIYNLYRLAIWINSERQRAKGHYSQVPTSPSLKKHRQSQSGILATWWRRVVWWLEGESSLGSERKFWVLSAGWSAWLLFLSVYETEDDYMHFTKRIGHVAISQLPIHYMLSMKSLHSPLALAFRTSHEQLNPYHRFLGRIIHYGLLIHGAFYMNFFFQKHLLLTKVTQANVVIGIVALSMLNILATTALAQIRRWSYRVFFVTHLIIGITILPLLFFHVRQARTYVVESLLLFIYDLIARKFDTIQGFSNISSVPNTNLLKLVIPVPPTKIRRFQRAPGQHVYLSIPPESIAKERASIIHDLCFNPFTVASVNPIASEITLVLRSLNGPTTTALSHLTKLPKAYPPINIEGSYGSTRHFPNFAAEFDRVLLVAGGIGATFILPIYNHIQESLHEEAMSPSQVHLVWSMRHPAEASWVEDKFSTSSAAPGFSDRGVGSSSHTETDRSSPSPTIKGQGKSQLSHKQARPRRLFSAPEDSNTKIFITGRSHQYRRGSDARDGSVELEDLDRASLSADEIQLNKFERSRPDLHRIVDGVFGWGNEERVAVIVCGPKGMALELRESVGKWVGRGREVWFHDEGFGW